MHTQTLRKDRAFVCWLDVTHENNFIFIVGGADDIVLCCYTTEVWEPAECP